MAFLLLFQVYHLARLTICRCQLHSRCKLLFGNYFRTRGSVYKKNWIGNGTDVIGHHFHYAGLMKTIRLFAVTWAPTNGPMSGTCLWTDLSEIIYLQAFAWDMSPRVMPPKKLSEAMMMLSLPNCF
jgi:hypothetical protein